MNRISVNLLCGALIASLGIPGAVCDQADAHDLPSASGGTIAQIKKMPPGSWLNLGAPRRDPKWGRARGRAWTPKMDFSKKLGGAFLFGEGVHGWANPSNGRYMDDLWFFDVNGHRWVNMYPGTDTRSPPKLVVTRDGFEGVAPDQPIPIASMVHGYEMTTWDPDRQLLFTMPNLHSYYRRVLPGLARFRADNAGKINRRQASPWMFNPWHRRWNRVRAQGRSPQSSLGHVLSYIPSKRKLFFYRPKQVHFYDPDTLEWTRMSPLGPLPPFGIDPGACHDPVRDRVYIGGGAYPVAPGPNALWYYDVRKNQWVDPRPHGMPGTNAYGTNIAIMACDTTSDRVYLFRHRGEKKGVYAYDPEKNGWVKEHSGLPTAWQDRRTASGFFHPGLGVHFFHIALDSKDDGTIIVYKPAAQ